MTDRSTDPMTTASKRAQSTTWRWLKRTVIVLATLFALTVAVFYALSKSVAGRWERYAAELRAAGEPLTFAQIEALRPPVPDERNGASVIENAIAMLQDIEEPGKENVFILDSDCEDDFFKGISEECIEPSRRYVAARRTALDELTKLRDYPHVRFDIPYETPALGAVPGLLELISRARYVGKLLSVAAHIEMIDDDTAAASERIVLMLRLSEALSSEPDLLPYLVCIAGDALAVKTTEGLLAVRQLDAKALLRLQNEWERQLPLRTMRWALLGERAEYIRMTDKRYLRASMQASQRNMPGAASRMPNIWSPLDWVPFVDDWFLLENRIQLVNSLSAMIDVTDHPSQLLAIARNQAATVGRYHPGKMFARMLLPSLERAVELHARSLAFS